MDSRLLRADAKRAEQVISGYEPIAASNYRAMQPAFELARDMADLARKVVLSGYADQAARPRDPDDEMSGSPITSSR